MLKFVLSRAVAAIPVIIIVSIATFALLRLAPGDPATALAGESATPEVVAAIREQFGLDKPLYIQYKIWIENMLEGDFGTSIISGQPVIDMIIDRLEPTLSLALVTITFAVLIAIPLGILAAAKRGTVIDKLVMLLAVVGFSVPVFVVAYILILFMSVDLQWFPVQGFRSIRDEIGEFALYITLPATALTLLYVALITRMTRTSILEVLNEDFVRTARAKGISETRVLFRHALGNAAVPIITIVAISFATMLTGVVVTESVFNLPGVGRLTIDAVLARDYPIIQAEIFLASIIFVLFNLAVDIIYALVDPRIRY